VLSTHGPPPQSDLRFCDYTAIVLSGPPQTRYGYDLNASHMATDLANIQNVPVAHAHRSSAQPLDGDGVVALAKPFAGTTVGQKYLGPAWVGDDGTPFVVLVAHDERWLRRLRTASECAFIAWRWNNSPSTYFSLTLMLKSGSPRPHVRWMRPSDDAVVQTIRRDARFLATVVNVRGQHYGWYEATFGSGFVKVASPSNQALERLWAFPTPGISCSNINVRFDPLRRKEYKETARRKFRCGPNPPPTFGARWATTGHGLRTWGISIGSWPLGHVRPCTTDKQRLVLSKSFLKGSTLTAKHRYFQLRVGFCATAPCNRESSVWYGRSR